MIIIVTLSDLSVSNYLTPGDDVLAIAGGGGGAGASGDLCCSHGGAGGGHTGLQGLAPGNDSLVRIFWIALHRKVQSHSVLRSLIGFYELETDPNQMIDNEIVCVCTNKILQINIFVHPEC